MRGFGPSLSFQAAVSRMPRSGEEGGACIMDLCWNGPARLARYHHWVKSWPEPVLPDMEFRLDHLKLRLVTSARSCIVWIWRSAIRAVVR